MVIIHSAFFLRDTQKFTFSQVQVTTTMLKLNEQGIRIFKAFPHSKFHSRFPPSHPLIHIYIYIYSQTRNLQLYLSDKVKDSSHYNEQPASLYLVAVCHLRCSSSIHVCIRLIGDSDLVGANMETTFEWLKVGWMGLKVFAIGVHKRF